MSKSYTDLPQTNYPDRFDAFENKSDLTNSMLALANTYKAYIARGNFADAKKFLENNNALKAMLITADDINKLQDAMMALQRVQMSVVYSATKPTPTSHPNQIIGNLWIQNVDSSTESGTVIYRLTAVSDSEYTYTPLTSPYSELVDSVAEAQAEASSASSAASAAQNSANGAQNTADTHIANKSNPHGVTKAQIGLGNVTNTQQMPMSGGTFTGSVYMQYTNSSGRKLRDIEPLTSGGGAVSTATIRTYRK